MTRSSPAWCAGLAWLLWLFASMWMRTCLAQFAISSSSPREAVASAGGVTVVAQLPGFGVINGLINAMHNNRFNQNQQQQQQQQFERLQQERPGWGPHRRGMPRPGFAPPNRQQPTPPGWPPGWQWGAGGNQNQPGFGWDQTGFGPGWNGGGGQGPEWNGGGGTGPGWNEGGGRGPPGWNSGGGRGPPPGPGFNGGGPPPPRPGWNGGGPPPPRPEWNGGGPPPPRPGWNGGGPPPPRPGWNGGMEQEWDNYPRFPDQPDPNDTNPNVDPNNESSTTPQTPVPEPSFPATTPKPAATFPTIQPRPPAQPTKDTLIIGNNRPPLVPPQNPDPPATTFPTWIVPEPLPKPRDESSENRAIIFPSSSKYIHVANQEVPSVPIDVRRR
ncbi:basic proline-rich protein [Drosophila yakuba]|uniref:Uncharacterized protein n=1 Tax=Drosophila yakuba TaxID=7245 RepID=B4PV26_DROYA|nr:basic proline-rich protein [Drosophila yakuba]EDW98875.2 uncharacterized protein Dyak_GE23524 [Drosophila yakuba]